MQTFFTQSSQNDNCSTNKLLFFITMVILCNICLCSNDQVTNYCKKGTCITCEKSQDLPNTNVCKMCINSFPIALGNGATGCLKEYMPSNCLIPVLTKGDYTGCTTCQIGYKTIIGPEINGKKHITCEAGDLIENCIIAQAGLTPERILQTRSLATASETQCLSCKEGMYLNNGVCTTVPKENIILNCQYYGSLTKCISCKEGFAVNTSDSDKCIENTDNCGSLKDGKCISCSLLTNFYAVGIKEDGNVICEAYSRIISYTIGALFIWIATMI